jgi:hypothetical protein
VKAAATIPGVHIKHDNAEHLTAQGQNYKSVKGQSLQMTFVH